MGKLYTHDFINLTDGLESDVISGGSGNFSDAKGSLTVASYPISETQIGISSLDGSKICK